MHKQINFIPVLNAAYFPSEVEDELALADISTHYQSDIVYITWEDARLRKFKNWLIETYGLKIKEYNEFAISAT